MSTDPCISIIIPVYNGAGYLRRCVDSVFANDFDDLEILLLDDGSKDDSLRIMYEYEKAQPEKVRVFSHENMGVARTRNRGIELSRGTYLLFLDQDDWFDRDYIRTFYGAIEESGSDVAVGGYKRPDESGRVVLSRLLPGNGYYRYITVAAWGKIHRAAFLKENGIEFFDNNIGEDVAFSMKEATLSQNYAFVPYVGYNWFMNKDSVSETEYKGFRDNVAIFPFLEKLSSFEYENDPIRAYVVIKAAYYYLMHSGRASTRQKYLAVYDEIMGWVSERYPGFLKNKFLNFGFPGETFKVRLAVHILTMAHRLNMQGLFASLYCRGR